jgi:uncharacterized protein with FMN-binding domain
MRRAPIVLTGTVAGVVAVLSFKPREPATPTVSAAATAAAPRTPSTRSPATTTPSTPKASGSGSSSATRTVTGDAIATPYGNAQVRVTIKDGRITDVQALQLQGNDPKSVQISGSAEPLLRQSALTRQSAAIDAVSGATFTSASYEASLQSALDKAGFKAADGSRGSSQIPQGEDGRGGPGGDGGDGPPPELFTP